MPLLSLDPFEVKRRSTARVTSAGFQWFGRLEDTAGFTLAVYRTAHLISDGTGQTPSEFET